MIRMNFLLRRVLYILEWVVMQRSVLWPGLVLLDFRVVAERLRGLTIPNVQQCVTQPAQVHPYRFRELISQYYLPVQMANMRWPLGTYLGLLRGQPFQLDHECHEPVLSNVVVRRLSNKTHKRLPELKEETFGLLDLFAVLGHSAQRVQSIKGGGRVFWRLTC